MARTSRATHVESPCVSLNTDWYHTQNRPKLACGLNWGGDLARDKVASVHWLADLFGLEVRESSPFSPPGRFAVVRIGETNLDFDKGQDFKAHHYAFLVDDEAFDRLAAAEDSDAVVLGGLAAFVGLSVAEALGIPAIGTGLIPIAPTRDFASPFLRPRTVPHWLNRASHLRVDTLVWRAFKSPTNGARAAVCGLPPRRKVLTEHPMLYGISPRLVPPPAARRPPPAARRPPTGRQTRGFAATGWRPRRIGRRRRRTANLSRLWHHGGLGRLGVDARGADGAAGPARAVLSRLG